MYNNNRHLKQRSSGFNSPPVWQQGGYSFCNRPVETRDYGFDSRPTGWKASLFDNSLSKGQQRQGLNQFSGSAWGCQTSTSYQYGQIQNSSRAMTCGVNGSFGASSPRSQVISPLFSPGFNNLLSDISYQCTNDYNVQHENGPRPLSWQAKYSHSQEQLWPTAQNYRTTSPTSLQTTNSSLGSNQNGSFESRTSHGTKEFGHDSSANWNSQTKRRHSGDWTRQSGSLQSLQESTTQRSILRLSSTPPTGQSVRFRKELEFSGVDGNLSFHSMDDTFDSKVVSIPDARLGFPSSQKPNDSSPSTKRLPSLNIDLTPTSMQTMTNVSNSPKSQSYELVSTWQYFFSKEHQELNEKSPLSVSNCSHTKEKTIHVVTSSERILKFLIVSFFVVTFGLYIIICTADFVDRFLDD